MTKLRQSKITTLIPALAVLAIASLALPRHAAAQVTWTGTSGGDWNTAANWSGGSKPTAADTALFNTTLTSVANAVADQTVRSISFNTNAGTAGNGFTIGTAGGNTLTLGNGGTVQILSTLTGTGKAISVNAPLVLSPASASTAGSYTFANNNSTATNTLNFGGPISGGLTSGTVSLTLDGANTGNNTIAGNISNGSAASLALVKSGGGTWVLSGTNTYTGNTTLAGGNINIAATSSLGVGGTISVTASGGNRFGSGSLSQIIVEGVNDPLTGHNISMAAGSLVGINVVSAANTVNLSGTISGSGNIFKKGLGTLRLSGNNTGFTGPFTLGDTSLSNGTVEFTNANAFGTGTINGNSSASVVMKNVSGGLLTLSNTFSSVNASGSFFFSGADTTLNGNQFGANIFYAATGMNLTFGGQINGPISLGAGSGYQGTYYLNTAPGSTSYVSSIRVSGAPTIGIAADNAFGVTTGAQYTDAAVNGLTLFASGADRSINSAIRWGGYNGVVNFTGSNNLTFSANQNAAWFNTNGQQVFNVTAPMLTFSGIINEAATTIWKNGSGVMVLSGANTYTGQTRLSQGVIRATDGVGLPATSNLYFAGNGGVLETSGTFSRTLGTTAGRAQWAAVGWVGDLVVPGSTGSGAGGFAAFGGPLAVQLNGGTAAVTWNSGNFVQSGGALVLGSTTADNVVDFRNAINLNGFTGTVRVNDNPNTTADYAIISGAISGASNLTKTGAGTLVLTNNSTYSGTTTISGGRLQVDSAGSISNSSRVVISGSNADLRWNSSTAFERPLTFTQGTISGSGSINTAVTVGTNNVLSPGNSPGIQTYTSGLTWASGGSYLWEINDWTGAAGTNFDQVAVSGSPLNISATSGSPFTINITSLTGSNTAGAVGNWSETSKTFTIATAGSLTNFSADKFTLNTSAFSPAFTGSWSITGTGNALQLNYTALPSTTTGSYSLAASAVSSTIIVGGTSNISSVITNTGTGTADTLDYGPLTVAYAGGTTSLTGSGLALAQGASGTATGGFTNNTAGTYTLTPAGTVTNATLGGAATLGTVTSSTVTVLDHSNAALSLASGGGQTIITGGTFGAVTFNLTNAGSNNAAVQVDGLVNLSGSTGSAVVASGGSVSYTGTGLDNTLIGVNNLLVSATAGDQQSLSGASALTTISATTSYTVLDHATSSLLASSVLTSTTLNLGEWDYLTQTWTSGTSSAGFSVFNLASVNGDALTALLALTSSTSSGDAGFSTNLNTYSQIAGGGSQGFSVSFDPTGISTSGLFTRTFTINMADQQNLSGAAATNTLTVVANVIVVPEPGSIALAGIGIAAAAYAYRRRRR
jgi:autotransporter-associated beta strand protein